MTTITKSFKIADLTVSRFNVRFNVEPSAERVQQLADNIKALDRLIHPMTVYVDDGVPGVVAGKTRLRALQYLIEDGRMEEDAEAVVFMVDTEEQARALSLSENVQRENMHPADECIAFRDLIADGKTIESVAFAFGQTVRYVEGRLRVANLAPALLDSFRSKDFPDVDQVMALCLTDDHAKQLAVWDAVKDAYYSHRTPASLRAAIMGEDTINGLTDRRTKLVSVTEYEAAGGAVNRSLFGDEVFLLDPALFVQLVTDKLNKVAAEVQAEGWSWVEVVLDRMGEAHQKHGITHPIQRDATEDEQAELDELAVEADRLRDVYEDCEVGSDEEIATEAALDKCQDRMTEIEEGRSSYTPEQLANGGALVGLDHEGAPKVLRGLVRREDRQAMDEALRTSRVAASVAGGRDTGDAGRPKGDTLAQALQDDLHGLRIIAVQNEVAKNARAAKIMLALWTLSKIDGRTSWRQLPTDLSVAGHGNLRERMHSLNVKDERSARDEALEASAAEFPVGDVERFDVLAGMSDEALDALIAKGVALTIMPDAKHEGVTAKLLDFIGFDMADHFTATAANYTGRASKKLVVQALTEAGKAKDADTLLTLKKNVLADTAAERLAGTGWVPELIRTPARPKPAPTKGDAGSNEIKAAAGKKAAGNKGTGKAAGTGKATKAKAKAA